MRPRDIIAFWFASIALAVFTGWFVAEVMIPR